MIAQRTQNQTREEENPKITFTDAVAMRPTPRSNRGDVRAPSTPEMNFDAPANIYTHVRKLLRPEPPDLAHKQHRAPALLSFLVLAAAVEVAAQ